MLDVENSYKSDTSFLRNPKKAQEKEQLLKRLDEYESKYIELANDNRLHELQQTPDLNIFSGIDQDMKPDYIYTTLFKKGFPMSKVLNYANGGSYHCPICDYEVVKEVDHFLPRSLFPQYTIIPSNLVPLCRDCNKHKSSKFSNNPNKLQYHPYFEEYNYIEKIEIVLRDMNLEVSEQEDKIRFEAKYNGIRNSREEFNVKCIYKLEQSFNMNLRDALYRIKESIGNVEMINNPRLLKEFCMKNRARILEDCRHHDIKYLQSCIYDNFISILESDDNDKMNLLICGLTQDVSKVTFKPNLIKKADCHRL